MPLCRVFSMLRARPLLLGGVIAAVMLTTGCGASRSSDVTAAGGSKQAGQTASASPPRQTTAVSDSATPRSATASGRTTPCASRTSTISAIVGQTVVPLNIGKPYPDVGGKCVYEASHGDNEEYKEVTVAFVPIPVNSYPRPVGFNSDVPCGGAHTASGGMYWCPGELSAETPYALVYGAVGSSETFVVTYAYPFQVGEAGGGTINMPPDRLKVEAVARKLFDTFRP